MEKIDEVINAYIAKLIYALCVIVTAAEIEKEEL
jgi:hypothetical protein